MSRPSNGSATTLAKARLLARQRALLAHLADPSAYDPDEATAEGLEGLDSDRLRTLGRLILAKRLGKLEAVLPATCRCMKQHAQALLHAFAVACPPTSLGRQENARQLHDFIVGHSGSMSAPGYLRDLVRLEYFVAAATFAVRDRPPTPPPTPLDPSWSSFYVRTLPDLRLLHTNFDLQRLMVEPPPAELERVRKRCVAVVPGGSVARVFWLEDDVAELLSDLSEWTEIKAWEPEDLRSAIELLAPCGLVEVRPCASV